MSPRLSRALWRGDLSRALGRPVGDVKCSPIWHLVARPPRPAYPRANQHHLSWGSHMLGSLGARYQSLLFTPE